MQYTLRKVPSAVDSELRKRARRDGKSLNTIALELLEKALGLSEARVKRRALKGIAGSWKRDARFDLAMRAFEQIDENLWR